MLEMTKLGKSIFVIVFLSMLFGCGKPQAVMPPIMPQQIMNYAPTSTVVAPISTEQVPTLPKGTTATAMAIDGGDMSISMSSTHQFMVTITLNNKQILKNWTAVKWDTSSPDIGVINSKGVFTPLREGTTKVIASISNVSAEIKVTITSALNIWYQVSVPTQQDLNAVKLVSNTEAWAVGVGGTLLHYFNGDWTDYSAYGMSPAAGANLTGIDILLDMNEGWAVGDNVILHLTNGTWQRVPAPDGGTFKAVDIVTPYDAWIVGSSADGKSLVLRFTGQSWQVVDTPIKGELNSVCALGPNDVWVSGKSSGALQSPNIYHFNGDKWEKAKFGKWPYIKIWDGKYNIKAIKMINSTQGWAVGESEPILSSIRGKKGVFFYYDNIKDSWFEGDFDKSANTKMGQVTLNNIAMLASNQGWILGNTVTPKLDLGVNNDIVGNLLKCDGKNISIETKFQATSIGKSFYGIDVLDNGNGIIVGEGGLVMQHQYDINRPYRYSNFSNFGYNYSGTTTGGYYGY